MKRQSRNLQKDSMVNISTNAADAVVDVAADATVMEKKAAADTTMKVADTTVVADVDATNMR